MDQAHSDILAATLDALARAPLDRRSPLRWPVLATSGPAARMVVMRAFTRSPPQIDLYTDARTPKVEQLRGDPRAELVFFDKSKSIQMRVRGSVQLHHRDDIARAAYGDGGGHTDGDYARAQAPGTDAPDPDAALGISGSAWENFMVLRVSVASIDWLELQRAGHRRARFNHVDGAWSAVWLTP